METQIGQDFNKVIKVLTSSNQMAHIEASDKMYHLFKKKWKSDRVLRENLLPIEDIYEAKREEILSNVTRR
jgi:septum formation inhibitor-activating ATPase MinD